MLQIFPTRALISFVFSQRVNELEQLKIVKTISTKNQQKKYLITFLFLLVIKMKARTTLITTHQYCFNPLKSNLYFQSFIKLEEFKITRIRLFASLILKDTISF